ncbi:hypothetical protein DXX93_09305 [Thalassotalea euphylliae]|uniref:Uncharacterized protein n=1 Tax=Thalassotalea euphylliae TaxID=1655234 RepID=A0A3E0TRZ4_9GAMM|nr:VC2046/SO_2500 family protein [Thalassotalea euphylliae]REL26752.1 hypothetical protein DXX93_09305 [Thalassotalea euphylliae]
MNASIALLERLYQRLAVKRLIENILLQHEHQLGESLNECVHQARRSDFALLLAMLNDDVRQQSQFLMPKTEQSEKQITDASLRAEFELPKSAELALNNIEQIQQYNQATLVSDNLMASVKLGDALNPKPLSFRDNKHHVPTDVLSNTSIHCQNRVQPTNPQDESSQQASAERLPLNAKGWLKAVQNTLVKTSQPLITEQFA